MKRSIEGFKRLLLIVLFLIMTVLIFTTVVLNISSKGTDMELSYFDRLLILHGYDSQTAELTGTMLLPEFAGYDIGYGGMGTVSDGLEAMYNASSECIAAIFGEASVCREASMAEWLAAIGSNVHVYIRYRSPMPSSVIAAYLSDGGQYGGAEFELIVSELCILGDGSAVAKTGDGLFFSITPGKSVPPVFSYFQAVNGLYPYTFGGGTGTIELSDSAPFFTQPPKDVGAHIVRGVPDEYKLTEGMLRMFGYNTENLSRYTDSDGVTAVYVDDFGNLRLSPDSAIFEGSEDLDGGLAISRLLGYSKDRYSVIDLLKAADSFVNGLGEVSACFTGGDAAPYLQGLRREGETVIVEYGLQLSGITVFSPELKPYTVVKLEFDSGCIRHAELYPAIIEKTGMSFAGFGVEWVLWNIERTCGISAAKGGIMRPAFVMNDSPAGAGQNIISEWTLAFSDRDLIYELE